VTLIATRPSATTADGRPLLTTHELALVVRRVASEPRRWRPHVSRVPGAHEVQLSGPAGVEVWLRNWLPSQHSELGDDGDSLSAFAVIEGALAEVREDDVLGSWVTTLQAPAVRVVERGVVYALRNDQVRPAVTIHAYAPGFERPPLTR
jgi:hypothetical protein